MKKIILGFSAALLTLTFLASAALAASPEKLIAAHERMLEIEQKLVTYEPGYGYAFSHRYSGYSVDENAVPTFYYPTNIKLSTIKSTLKSLKVNSSGIKFVEVEHSLYNLKMVLVALERLAAENSSRLGYTPVLEFLPETNWFTAYGVPEDEASRKTLLACFGWDASEDALMTYRSTVELTARSNRALALLPKAVINSEKFMGCYAPTKPGRPVVLLTEPEDAELRKLIPMFFDVRKPDDAHSDFASSTYDAPGTQDDKRELRRCYFSAYTEFLKSTAFGQTALPFTAVSYDPATNKVNVGVPALTDALRKKYEEAIGKSPYLNLMEETIVTKPG